MYNNDDQVTVTYLLLSTEDFCENLLLIKRHLPIARTYTIQLKVLINHTLLYIRICLLSGGFQGIIGVLAQGAITLCLWYGGKLVYDQAHGKHTGLTPGVLTCKFYRSPRNYKVIGPGTHCSVFMVWG